MITKKMKALVEGGSAIRAMFEEGKKWLLKEEQKMYLTFL